MAKKKVFQISNALAEGLEETVSIAHNFSGELRVEAIPLKRIELDPNNPRELSLTFTDLFEGIKEMDASYERKMQEKGSLLSLANSINEQGIINPIMVYKHHDKYRLIAGERRTLASIVAGKSEIQARILDSKPSPLKISLLQWMENIERKDLSLWERLSNLETIIQAYATSNALSFEDITATELGRLLGCSLPHAMNYMAVLKANEKVKNLIQANQIKNLEKAALLAQIKSKDVQEQAISACIASAPLKRLKQIANQDKQKLSVVASANKTTRGRQPSVINMGTTKKIGVAKLIIDSILNHEKVQHLQHHFSELNWTDYKDVTHGFKQLIKSLEQIEA